MTKLFQIFLLPLFFACFNLKGIACLSDNPLKRTNSLPIGHSIDIFQQISLNIDSVGSDKKIRAKEKLIALGLCIALGPFGVHRLFLGTSEKVPILYTLTLGGGLGILPILDFFTIIFTKDLKIYKNNTNVFLWTPNKKNQIKDLE